MFYSLLRWPYKYNYTTLKHIYLFLKVQTAHLPQEWRAGVQPLAVFNRKASCHARHERARSVDGSVAAHPGALSMGGPDEGIPSELTFSPTDSAGIELWVGTVPSLRQPLCNSGRCDWCWSNRLGKKAGLALKHGPS